MKDGASRYLVAALLVSGALGCGDGSGDQATGEDTSAVSGDADAVVDTQCVGARTGAACDDGNPCTEDDTCIDEVCRGGVKSCDDGDPCTDDSCDRTAGGCVSVPNDATCDDDDPCTINDRCGVGGCAGAPASAVACNDGDPCTRDDECNAGVCAGVPHDCDDGNPCTVDACDPSLPGADPGTGCSNEPSTASCDDGNSCTTGDVCADGQCAGTPTAGGDCSDGDLCTDGDVCQADGSCVGVQVNCDDGDVCTRDECVATLGCRHPPDEGVVCDDLDPCTIDDVCDDDGICVGAAKPCQGPNLCIVGSCDADTGACVDTPLECDDGEQCTTDTCDPGLGCVNDARTGACDDGDLCTSNDRCQQGSCAGDANVCDTSSDTACAKTSCDPQTGACVRKQLDGTLCDDGDLCTNSDVCAGGMCIGVAVACVDGDPCTVDSCDPLDGSCTHDQLSVQECDDLALDRANEYRAVSVGLRPDGGGGYDVVDMPPLDNHEQIIDAAVAHCEYYVNNPGPYDAGLSPHNEQSGLPGFTGVNFGQRLAAAGYAGSPMFEVMAFVNDPIVSVDEWMATLYHRIPFVIPAALHMGYGAAEVANRRCDTIDFGRNPTSDPGWEGLIIPFPPDGHSGVPIQWHGFESPQPPLPNLYPSGPILTVTFASQSGYPSVSITDSTINSASGPIPHVAYSPATDPELCCGVVSIYPNQPIQTHTEYTVTIDYVRDGAPGTFEWSFTTGNGASIYFLP